MNKKVILLFFVLVSFIGADAQTDNKKLDIRFGFGTTWINEKFRMSTVEMELNRKFTPYLAVGTSLAYGREAPDAYAQTSFDKGNLSLYVSPFRNDKRNDFRIGAGISYFDIAGFYATGMLFNPEETEYYSYKNSSFGFIFSLENSYMLTDRFFVGIKAFAEPFLKETVKTNYGAMLKLGVNF